MDILSLHFSVEKKDAVMDDILVSMVAKINENPELHNFERLSERSTDLFEKMRRICGKQFESDYLQKRRALSEAKLKFKEERKLLSVNNPKLYLK